MDYITMKAASECIDENVIGIHWCSNLRQYDLAHDLLLGACVAGVHSPYPTELITCFEVFRDAFGLGELGGNEVNLLNGLTVYINEVLYQGVFHQHQCECIGLMLFEKLLAHTSEAADVTGRLGRECEVGIVIVSVLGVGDFHMRNLLYEPMYSFMASVAFSSRLPRSPAIKGIASMAPAMASS